jgi:hypothetical protein
MSRIRQWLRLAVVLPALCGLTLCACTPKPPPTTPPPPLAVRSTDLDGRPLDPLMPGALGTRATVLLFITNDCPISNSYAPEIHRLCDAYTKQGIAFYIVYADPELKPGEARRHYHDYAYQCPAVIDVGHDLARKAGATVTPEAVVLLRDGTLGYRGRINDLYIDYGKAKYVATTHDLREVLASIAGDRPVTPRTTDAVGCPIPL